MELATQIIKDIEKERNERGKQVVRLLTRFVRLHRCPVCGKLTDNKKYCSGKCAAKARDAVKDVKRRQKIKNALVDEGINLIDLFKRDKGICAICGEKCEWNDHKRNGRYFIAGANYPSIDHIKPLAAGGAHAWGNVQLAHIKCNSKKGARYCG